MAGQQQKVSVFLTGSVDEQQVDELKGPMLQQGASPNLDDSRNTRLSLRRGTCVRAPDVTPLGVDLPDGHPAYGIVSNGPKRNYALYTTPDQGNRVVGEDGYEVRATTTMRGESETGARQCIFMPWQMPDAGQLPGVSSFATWPNIDGVSSAYNATLDELWVVWVETTDNQVTTPICYAAAYDRDMTLLVRPRKMTRGADASSVGVTAHGASGMRLWNYRDAAPTGSSYRTLSMSAGQPVLGAAVAVAPNPLSSVVAQDDTYAYVLTNSGTDGALLKVNITTGVSTQALIPGAWGNIGSGAIECLKVNNVNLVSAIINGNGVGVTTSVIDEALAFVLPPAIAAGTEDVTHMATKFLLAPAMGIAAAVYAISQDGTTGPNTTKILGRQLASDAQLPTLDELYWHRLYNKGAQWSVSATESYPVFFSTRNYRNVYSADSIQQKELLDPSVTGYVVGPYVAGTTLMTSPVARFGCVRGTMAPVATAISGMRHALTSEPRIGDDLFVTYRKADSYRTARYVKIRTTPEQPPVAHDRDGVAIAAAALVSQWDGGQTVEFGGPLHIPVMVLGKVTGATPGLVQPEAGVYGFTAIYEWFDDAGLLHRSMPAPTQSLTFTGSEKLTVKVLSHDVMRIGQSNKIDVSAVFYMTDPNGTAYCRLAVDYVPTGGYYQNFKTIYAVGVGPIIYSRGLLGEELVPQPPPPLRDVAVVGSRLWGIDAEVPTRLVYSKLRVAGIGFEWFPAGELIVPSNAGDVIALREQSGSLIVFAERAIFQVSDGGPNNQGSGSFGSPYKISELGTKYRHSVVSMPQGIMFLDGAGRFSVLRGAAVAQLPGANVLTDIRGAFVLEDAEEVVFPLQAEAKVYNYALSRWTNWDLPQPPVLVAQSAISRDTGLMYAQTNGRTYTVLSTVKSTTAIMSWETDWFLLGGDFQDYNVAYDVIFNAYNDSPHGIRIELLTEYDDGTATTSREWTASELAALSGPTGRYTVRIEPVRQDARGMKIKIRELENPAPHIGCRPGTVTIVYSVDGMTYEESNIPGSHK